jgi:plastocyanin
MKLLTTLTIVALSAPSFADTLIVTANASSWSPDVVNCVPGDVLRFEYGTGYPHTITSGTSCTYDGLYFDEPLSSPGDYYEFTVPDDGTTEIPFFCAPHCNNGMTGVIMIDLPDGHMEIGIVNIVNPAPLSYSRSLVTETILIEGFNVLGTSFLIGVEIDMNDVDVDWTAVSGSNELKLVDVAANASTVLNGSGTVTLTAGKKYAFIGKTFYSNFTFSIEFPSHEVSGGDFTAFEFAGYGSVVATGDSMMFRSAYSNAGETGEITFIGEGDIPISIVGDVTSSTLTLPPLGEEGVVSIPAGLHIISFENFGLLTMNMGNGDDAGSMPEDVNGDGVVGVDDLLAIIAAWGATSP